MLTPARWAHIVERHAELARSRDALLAAVRFPVASHPGHEANEEWYYARGVGPARWIRVVVHYHDDVGLVTTAFPRGDLP